MAQKSEKGSERREKPGSPGRVETIQIVEFVLGSEAFAIDLFDVKEVVEYTTITKMPDVPSYIRGIIDLRGEITTIIDLKQRLGIADAGEQPMESARIIVLDTRATKAKSGILVDDVTSVSMVEPSQVDYSSATTGQRNSSIIGIIKKKISVKDKEKNDLIIWIDIRKILEGSL